MIAGLSTFPNTEFLLLVGETELGRSAEGFSLFWLLTLFLLLLSRSGGFVVLHVWGPGETTSSSGSSIGYILITDSQDQTIN